MLFAELFNRQLRVLPLSTFLIVWWEFVKFLLLLLSESVNCDLIFCITTKSYTLQAITIIQTDINVKALSLGNVEESEKKLILLLQVLSLTISLNIVDLLVLRFESSCIYILYIQAYDLSRECLLKFNSDKALTKTWNNSIQWLPTSWILKDQVSVVHVMTTSLNWRYQRNYCSSLTW